MTDSPSGPNQSEHIHISTVLEVETLDTNVFRSKSLRVPVGSRGVFGGQVISQAIVSATNCVDKSYGLHVSHSQRLTAVLVMADWNVSSPYMYVCKTQKYVDI